MMQSIPVRLSVWACVIAMAIGCDARKAVAPAVSSPPPFASPQPGRRPSPAEERETKVLPLDSDNCTTSDTTIIDFTSGQVTARCESTGATTKVMVTVTPRTTDPADYLRAFSLRFCGDLIDAEGPSAWTTEIDREKERTGVAADVTWKLQEAASPSNGSPPVRIVGFAVRLRGQWHRGLRYYVAFSKSGGPFAGSPHDCPYAPGDVAAAPAGSARSARAGVGASTSECVSARELQAEPRRVNDAKPDLSDLRGVRTHGRVLVFNIRISPTGSVSDARLAKGINPEPPWPTLAERWQAAILHWRFEPATVNNKPVAVCLTVLARVEVE